VIQAVVGRLCVDGRCDEIPSLNFIDVPATFNCLKTLIRQDTCVSRDNPHFFKKVKGALSAR